MDVLKEAESCIKRFKIFKGAMAFILFIMLISVTYAIGATNGEPEHGEILNNVHFFVLNHMQAVLITLCAMTLIFHIYTQTNQPKIRALKAYIKSLSEKDYEKVLKKYEKNEKMTELLKRVKSELQE